MAIIRDKIATIGGYRIHGNSSTSNMYVDGYRFRSSNHSGLGNFLKKLSFTQKDIKSVYAFMRSLV
jgi:hypothetical protein